MHYQSAPKNILAWNASRPVFEAKDDLPDFIQEAVTAERLALHPFFDNRLQLFIADEGGESARPVIVDDGDWIIKDKETGELNVVKADEFPTLYKEVDGED